MKTDPKRKESILDAATLRQKAEELLKEKQLKADLQLSESEMQKLVHELGVHQIELELQNKELTLAKEKAEVASKKYVELYDAAPSGYFTLTKSGEIIETNFSGASLLGKERSRLKNGLFGFFVSDETKSIFNHFLRNVFIGKAEESCEVALSTNGESLRYVQLTGIVTENGKQCFITAIDVTERRQLEKDRLESSEERYRLLFEESADGILIVDIETKTFKYANPALCRMLGYTEAELTTLSIADIHPKQDLQRVVAEFESQARGERVLAPDIPCLRKDGSIVYADINTNTINLDGRFCAVGLFRDITERKQAEETLRDSERRYHLLIETVNEGISVAQNGFLKFVNPMMQVITGFTQEELLTLPFLSFVYPEDREIVISNHLKRQEGEPFSPRYQFRIMKKDGSLRKIEMNGVVIEWEGEPATLNIFADITEREHAEETLQNERTLLRLLIDNVPDLIYTKDMACRKTLVNSADVLNMGVKSESEVLGKDDFAFFPKEMAEKFYADEQSVIQTGQPLINKEEYTLNELGQEKWFLSSKFPLRDQSGQIIGLVGIGRDISERKQAEEEIKLKNEQLQKLNAEKDKFFSIIAHDLRGPFNGFLGLTEILADDLQRLTMEEIQDYSVSLKKSATNLFLLLENLLLWSRMQQGSIPFNPKSWQMLQVVKECMAMEPANNKGISLVYDIPDPIEVCADKNMLQTVIRNLVSNALKFTPKGGKISISAKVLQDNSVEMTVKDTGIGMSPSMVDDLFKLDVQTNRKGTEGEPSTGLGMLLCKEFVEKQRGTIRVESEVGKGSTFKFTLPMGNC